MRQSTRETHLQLSAPGSKCRSEVTNSGQSTEFNRKLLISITIIQIVCRFMQKGGGCVVGITQIPIMLCLARMI